VPIIRRIIALGNSRSITLPKGWIDYLERKAGCRITEVAIEVDHILTIEPIIPDEKEASEG